LLLTALTLQVTVCVSLWLRNNICTCTYKKPLRCHIDTDILEKADPLYMGW